MKFLVLLALLGAASAQYIAGYSPYFYSHHQPLVYNSLLHTPVTYPGYPYTTLPYSFVKPVEAKEAEKPAVEVREKRSADDQEADDATLAYTYAAHPLTYNYGYNFPSVYSGVYPTVYNRAYTTYTHPYTYLHSIKKRSADDQQAEDATYFLRHAAHPLTYNYGYNFPSVYSGVYPTVYNRAYTTYTHPYTYLHSIKKRSADDQQADDSHHVLRYAANTYPLTYTHGYNYATYPTVYNAAHPSFYSSAYTYPFTRAGYFY